MAIKSEVLDAFAQDNPYFNTFAGNPVSMAAAQAVLNYIRENDILEHTRAMGEKLRAAVSDIATRHPQLADVRGAGLFTGVEVVRPAPRKPIDLSPFPSSKSCVRTMCLFPCAVLTAMC